ncbi:MAG TPA: antibiotic biosynthesis monooxygenase [Chloroflexota bacterium]|nr:antibiotic biosynthesis monooxygenase [Chloroflexota bacterium]
MYLFLFRVHAKSADDVQNVCRVFEHTLRLFQEPGWLGGSCVINLDDSRDVLIYEMWGSLPALRAWLGSEARQEAHRQIAPYVEGPPVETTFQEAA